MMIIMLLLMMMNGILVQFVCLFVFLLGKLAVDQ